MKKPKIAGRKPIIQELEVDKKYFFCTCGESAKQPYCDGSHRGTPFVPLPFQPEKAGKKALCLCKYSNNLPYCDGSHKNLPDEAEKKADTRQEQQTASDSIQREIRWLSEQKEVSGGFHGEMVSMGVPVEELPKWNDIQILVGQLAKKPLPEDTEVSTELVIGSKTAKPLTLKTPIFVSDMSFGALSRESKIALSKGAALAGTGICSGEGGMMPEEQQANDRYLYELASAKFGYDESVLSKVQAFHFKAGQAAKTGIGGHLPAEKITDEVAEVRKIATGKDAISPPTFPDLSTPDDFKQFADQVRKVSGGIPVGMKLSANHLEEDLDFAVAVGVDYVILDGRGGGTGAAPALFRDHISLPTIPALNRARKHLDRIGEKEIKLIITGGLRTPADFIKALCLGADGIAISKAALISIGCVDSRICNSNQCPIGIATQDPELRKKLDVEKASIQLANFLNASTELIKTMARACGYTDIRQFNKSDLVSWKKEIAELAEIQYAGQP